MDVERNKQSFRRVFEEGFNAGRLEVVDDCLAAGATDRHEFTEDAPDFRSHLKGVITTFRGMFPDLMMTVEDVVAEGDRVAGRVVMTGTHTGDALLGIEPSGNAVRIEQFHFVQFGDDARATVHWASVGESELLQQLTQGALAPS